MWANCKNHVFLEIIHGSLDYLVSLILGISLKKLDNLDDSDLITNNSEKDMSQKLSLLCLGGGGGGEGGRHVLAKIDYCCPFFMHLELKCYHFWPKKKSAKIDAVLHA